MSMVIGAMGRNKAGKGTRECWARAFAYLIDGFKEMRGEPQGYLEDR